MRIRTHLGISVDGYAATPDGRPALLSVPSFVPGESHGHPEFIAECGAVLMGRNTLEPALGAERWPWGEMPVFVLTSRALPPELPAQVSAAPDASALLEQMREADFEGDVHLVGGPTTIAAFHSLGALDRLEVVVLPIVLGDGLPLVPAGTDPIPLRLAAHRSFPDGSVELAYELAPVQP